MTNRNLTLILTVAIIILSVFLWKGCENSKYLDSKLQQASNNNLALIDSVRIEKTKNGENQFIKNTLVTNLNDLKTLNFDLYKEVKNQKKDILYISKLTASIIDSLKKRSNSDVVSKDIEGNDEISWKFDTINPEWSRIISGKTAFKVILKDGNYKIESRYSELEKFNQTMKITTGLQASTTQKGMLEIFVKSTYPGMSFSNIEGSIINPNEFKKYLPVPKPTKWSFGPYIGLGYGLVLQKTPILAPTLNIGLGLQYKIFNF